MQTYTKPFVSLCDTLPLLTSDSSDLHMAQFSAFLSFWVIHCASTSRRISKFNKHAVSEKVSFIAHLYLYAHLCHIIPYPSLIAVKVKLSRYTPWRRMGWEEVQLLFILILGTRWGWVVRVTPRPRFTPGERTPSTHCTRGWVGPRAGLDAGDSRKILCPCQGSNLDRPARSQTLYCLSYRGSVNRSSSNND
jgi:hypothetical protein